MWSSRDTPRGHGHHGDNMGLVDHVAYSRSLDTPRDIITNGIVIRVSRSNYAAIKSSTA